MILNDLGFCKNIFYFSSSMRDINKTNRWGTGGVLTEELSQLMIAMWAGRFRSVAPASFKRCLNATKSSFNDNEQHDAQEFMAEILDAIHEDLNSRAGGAKAPEEGAHLHLKEDQVDGPSSSNGESSPGGGGGGGTNNQYSFAVIGSSLEDETASKLSTEVRSGTDVLLVWSGLNLLWVYFIT